MTGKISTPDQTHIMGSGLPEETEHDWIEKFDWKQYPSLVREVDHNYLKDMPQEGGSDNITNTGIKIVQH